MGSVNGQLVAWPSKRTRLRDLVCGAPGCHGPFGGNGTAVHTIRDHCIANSTRELQERHLCARFWYDQAFRPKQLELPHWARTHAKPSVSLYGLAVVELGAFFVISVVSQDDPSFFALGAALRPTLDDAAEHAFGEAAMLLSDFVRGRTGGEVQSRSSAKVLMLRDAPGNRERHAYFESLVRAPDSRTFVNPANPFSLGFHINTVTFQPAPGIFAARSFSSQAMDPAAMASRTRVPTLPLC
jgi:YcaO cyclodehydratase, ATP-ad Mg2+-binding